LVTVFAKGHVFRASQHDATSTQVLVEEEGALHVLSAKMRWISLREGTKPAHHSLYTCAHDEMDGGDEKISNLTRLVCSPCSPFPDSDPPLDDQCEKE